MKTILISTLLFVSSLVLAQEPEKIVQTQLDAYNIQDIKGFLATYSDSVEVYNFATSRLILKGKAALEKEYSQLFKNYPNNYAALHGRIVQGNYVIDKEYVTGRETAITATAVYFVENNLIRKVWFLR